MERGSTKGQPVIACGRRLRAILVLAAILACCAFPLPAQTETLTLHLIMHVPEYANVDISPVGEPELDTNSFNGCVSMETYEWEHDDGYTVVCIEHV